MPSDRLQLSLSAKGLANFAGIFSNSDPFAVVTSRGDSKNNPPEIVGQTEVVYNSLNPNWATVVFLDGYTFGVPFFIEIGVFHFSSNQVGKTKKDLAKQSSETSRLITADESTRRLMREGQLPHKVMGTALFEVGQLLGARGNIASKSLQSGGAIVAHIERTRRGGSFGVMHFQLQACRLPSKSLLGFLNPSPYFELLRKVDSPNGAIWTSVYRSNVIKSSSNPKWESTRLQLEAVCNGDMNRAMKVVIKDYVTKKEIGDFETTMQAFVESKAAGGARREDVAFQLRRRDKDVGIVMVLRAETTLVERAPDTTSSEYTNEIQETPEPMVSTSRRPEFVDYLSGGLQISLAVAIDFTASNGNPRLEGTPHYVYPAESNQKNSYEKAIIAVGRILASYDSDGMIPTWGFGAKYGSTVRHCFQCGDEEEAQGVEGVLDAYRAVFSTPLTMSFPTVFTEVIRTAVSYAENERETAMENGELSYTILLILTAGNVLDLEETQMELAMASDFPISVVIVGIGDHDFTAMRILENHNPHQGGRDITKFVCLDDYNTYSGLSKAVLQEIPKQVVDYFYERGIEPGGEVEIDHETVHVMPADDDDRTVTFLG